MLTHRAKLCFGIIYLFGMALLFTYIPWVARYESLRHYYGHSWVWSPPSVHSTLDPGILAVSLIGWSTLCALIYLSLVLLKSTPAPFLISLLTPRVRATAAVGVVLLTGVVSDFIVRGHYKRVERYQLIAGEKDAALDSLTGKVCFMDKPGSFYENAVDASTSPHDVTTPPLPSGYESIPICGSGDPAEH